jgi:hypothetical protein
MKNVMLPIGLLVLLAVSPVLSQTFMDHVKAVKGDTLVVKNQVDESGAANALYIVLNGDSASVPAGRVYELQANGVYPLQNNPNMWANRTTVIVGSDPTPLVKNTNATSAPPLVTGFVGTTTNMAGFGGQGNLIAKNIALTPCASDGSENWAFHGSGQAHQRIEYNNCLFEHTRWIMVAAFNDSVTFVLKNDYFVNLNGQPCRRNGGVYDGFNVLDTMLVENCTHINAQGSMYKWRNYPANRLIVNHNTFVNCAGYLFLDLGYQSHASYTNNLFVNSNDQAYSGIQTIDPGEQDLDWQPMGLVNMYPDSADAANHVARKFLVDNNLAYWDPMWSNLVDTLNTLHVNAVTNWKSNQITMNTRTTAMFADYTTYPYLTNGKWYTEKPLFTNSANLETTALRALKTYVVAVADTGSLAVLADWRLVNTGASNYVYFDWPIPVDLSYSNATLLTGATNGFPVGDLNWFPTQKTSWLAQRSAEYTKIQTALDNGTSTGVTKTSSLPSEFRLAQNYPNPFNPTTTISYSLPHSANASLKVFNVLGQEVATLVDGYQAAGAHEVQFDASRFASGVYFYKLTSGNVTQMKKMMLVK